MPEKNKKISAIGYVTDFSVGFFIFPFLFFIAKTTIYIVKSPKKITESMALIYIALLTGIVVLLQRKVIWDMSDNTSLNWIIMSLGLVLYILFYYL